MIKGSPLHAATMAALGLKLPFGAGLASTEIAADLIAACGTPDELSETIKTLRDMLGFEHLVFHSIPPANCADKKPFLSLTYDPAWVDRYHKQDYFRIDPVVLRGARNPLPFDWAEMRNGSSCVRAFFIDADRHDVGRNGITMPIRGPSGERSLLTATSNVGQEDWCRFRRLTIRVLAEIGQYVHEQAERVQGRRDQGSPKISARERQCLQMMAYGKSPKDISRILDISTSAVRLYLYSARSKLGSATLYQAVAKAVALQIISA